MSNPASTAPAHGLAAGLVGLSVVAGTCAALNGLLRFDLAQLVVSGLVAAVATIALLVSAMRGDGATRAGRLIAAWSIVVLWVLGQAVARGNGARAWDQVVLFAVAGLPLLAAWATPAPRAVKHALGIGLGLSAIAFGVVSVLQVFGVAVPPPVPFATDVAAGIRGLADDPWNAASWGLVAAPACAALAMQTRGVARGLAIAGAIAAGLVIGLADQMTLALALLLAALAGTAAAFTRPGAVGAARRVAVALLAPAVVAVAAAAATPAVEADPNAGFGGDELEQSMIAGRFAPWSDPGALGYYRRAARAWALSEPGLGHGPGAFVGGIQGLEDADDPWALRHTSGHQQPQRAPVPAFELLGDYGVVVPLFVLATLLLALGVAFRRAGSTDAGDDAAAGAVGIAVVVAIAGAMTLAPGLLTTPAMLAAGTGLAAIALAAPDRARSGHPTVGVGVAACLALACAAASFQTLQWARPAASGVVYLGHSIPFEALAPLQTASERQLRYESERNLAIAMIYTPAEEHEPRVIADHLLAAARLRPTDAVSRYLLANHFIRNLVTLSDDPASLGQHRLEVIAALRRAVELDPNFVDAAILLSQTHMGHVEGPQARDVLEALAERDLPAGERARVFGQLGLLYSEVFDDPARAAEWYQRALDIEIRDRARRYYEQQIETMQTWAATGRRPQVDDTDHPPHLRVPGNDPHAGHDHAPGEHPEDDGDDTPQDEHGDEHGD